MLSLSLVNLLAHVCVCMGAVLVQEGALRAMYSSFIDHVNVGIVVPKFIQYKPRKNAHPSEPHDVVVLDAGVP